MNHRKFEVERAHRTGNPTTGPGDSPRSMVVKLLRLKDRVPVLERAKNLRGTYIILNKDYFKAMRKKRKELIPAMKATRAFGDIVHLHSQKPGVDERARPMG